jgi:uncharacterized YccA/Bax inhibitor family protein
MKSSNPTFSKKIFENYSFSTAASQTMTVQGTVNKIALMLALVIASAAFTWTRFFGAEGVAAPGSVLGWLALGGIGGFILAIIISFKKEWAPVLAPIYAVLEGLFLGAISAFFESMYPGIIMKAVALTFSVLFALLFMYKTGIIRVTQKFRTMVIAATIGIAVAYFVSFIIGLFGVDMNFMYGGGTLGIVISLVIVAVAAMNLVLDFDFIDQGAQAGLPKFFEWYGAFGLMVTLIWLYLEIIRLLAILNGRD